MKYEKKVTLKDGRSCVIRNGTEDDAQAVLDNFILTHRQTDYLATYPEEASFTLEQEKDYLKKKEASEKEAALIAEVDGVIVGTAGVDRLGSIEKVRHRATFGISIDQAWWGLGIGRALTEACIECARNAGYSQLELEVVEDNSRAVRLYKSEGFCEYGRNPKGMRSRQSGWQPIVLMRLELNKASEGRHTVKSF